MERISGSSSAVYHPFPICSQNLEEAMQQALELELKSVQALLANPKFLPDEEFVNDAWKKATDLGPTGVEFLLQNSSLPPNLHVLLWSTFHNHWALIEQALAHPHFAVKKDYETIVQDACLFGHSEIVELLVEDGRFDLQGTDNKAIKTAAKYGNVECVRLLLPKTDPTAENNYAIRHAGNGAVATLLLTDPRVDPCANKSEAFVIASENNRPDVIEALLKDGRADPTANRCKAWDVALKKRHNVCLNLLDDRIDELETLGYFADMETET